jgi:hypothetical protein
MRRNFKHFAVRTSLFALFFLLVVVSANAQSPSPEDKTEELKDKLISNIASRVAQLNLVEKRGIIGTVTESTNTQVTVTDLKDNTRFIDVDELTRFSSEDDDSFGISDIEEGMTIGVLGLYNKESKRILARFINTTTTTRTIHGGVASINDEEFTVSVTTDEGEQITVDIEILTQTFSYTKDLGYLRSGFSKIEKNQNIIVIGLPDIKEENRMTATRILIFPEIPVSPRVNEILKKSSQEE